MINNNPTVSQNTRRVTLLASPYLHPATNLMWTLGLDNRGFQYQIALDALPPGISLNQVRQGQIWFVDNSTTAYRLKLFVSDPNNVDPSLLPQFPPTYGNYYDTTTQTATLANTPYIVTFNTDAGSNGFTLVSGSRITANATGVYIFSFSGQFALINTAGNSVYNASVWSRVNGVDVPWAGGEFSMSSKNPYVLPAWNFIQQMNAGDYLQLVWGADNANQVQVVAQSTPPYGPSVPSWTMTVSQA